MKLGISITLIVDETEEYQSLNIIYCPAVLIILILCEK